jgi:hypothetical protein
MLSANGTVNETGSERDGKFRPGNRGGGGKALMQARAREDEAARLLEVEAILADFGRQPSHLEKRLIGELASELVRARRLRSNGKAAEAAECTRLISRLAGQLGINRAAPRARPQSPSFRERLLAERDRA